MIPISYTSFFGFIVGLPTLAATYYQSWKSRRESEEVRRHLVFSGNCLEFILEDGTSINLVPLETLHKAFYETSISIRPTGLVQNVRPLEPK
jgi:hypothetical protein